LRTLSGKADARPDGSRSRLSSRSGATVTDDRITEGLGSDAAIWSIEAEVPHNDVVKRPVDLAEFRRLVRSTFNLIKRDTASEPSSVSFPPCPYRAL
jgi:hypothetical protein